MIDMTRLGDGPVRRGLLLAKARDLRSDEHRAKLRTRGRIQRDLEAMDGRAYRCPGCGDWRYRSTNRHIVAAAVKCRTCGAAA